MWPFKKKKAEYGGPVCPNCGAPIDDDSFVMCESCGAVYDWFTMANIRRELQDAEADGSFMLTGTDIDTIEPAAVLELYEMLQCNKAENNKEN